MLNWVLEIKLKKAWNLAQSYLTTNTKIWSEGLEVTKIRNSLKLATRGTWFPFFRIRTQFQAFPKNCHFSPSDQILVFDVRKLCAKFHAFSNFISKTQFNIRKIQKNQWKKYMKFMFLFNFGGFLKFILQCMAKISTFNSMIFFFLKHDVFFTLKNRIRFPRLLSYRISVKDTLK